MYPTPKYSAQHARFSAGEVIESLERGLRELGRVKSNSLLEELHLPYVGGASWEVPTSSEDVEIAVVLQLQESGWYLVVNPRPTKSLRTVVIRGGVPQHDVWLRHAATACYELACEIHRILLPVSSEIRWAMDADPDTVVASGKPIFPESQASPQKG